MRTETGPDARVVNGEPDARGGGEAVLHVEGLPEVDDEGEPQVGSGEERGLSLLTLSLLERVEGVAVAIHGTGAVAEHSDPRHILSLHLDGPKPTLLTSNSFP